PPRMGGAPVTMALLVGCCRRARLHFALIALRVSTPNGLPTAHEPRAVRPPMAPREFNPHIHRSATASLATSLEFGEVSENLPLTSSTNQWYVRTIVSIRTNNR